MYFRFAAGLMLVAVVSMAGVWLEKQTLEMRRTVSVQYYQTDVLLDLLVRMRLETQQLTAPAQMALTEETQKRPSTKQSTTDRRRSRISDRRNDSSKPAGQSLPFLRFQHPFNPEGID